MTPKDTSACCMVRDLLPLYVEGMVSEESAALIRAHIDTCPTCRGEWEALTADSPVLTPPCEETVQGAVAPLKKIRRRLDLRLHSVAYLALIFFALFGFSLSAGADILFNALIMPVVGVFGYLAFGWRAVYKVPLLLVVVDCLALLMHLTDAHPLDMVAFTFLYTAFALVGVAIAFLLHFAFRREPS